jgi:hypothetical protein
MNLLATQDLTGKQNTKKDDYVIPKEIICPISGLIVCPELS